MRTEIRCLESQTEIEFKERHIKQILAHPVLVMKEYAIYAL